MRMIRIFTMQYRNPDGSDSVMHKLVSSIQLNIRIVCINDS